jgi:hypothetical protein
MSGRRRPSLDSPEIGNFSSANGRVMLGIGRVNRLVLVTLHGSNHCILAKHWKINETVSDKR